MIENKIFLHLSTTTSVTAIAGGRIYAVILPQKPTYPAVTYQRVAGTRECDMTNGSVNLEHPIIQMNSFSETFDEAANLSSAITYAMEHATAFKALALNSPIDTYEDEINKFRRIQDFSIWNRE
jgi:hypothetical protein